MQTVSRFEIFTEEDGDDWNSDVSTPYGSVADAQRQTQSLHG